MCDLSDEELADKFKREFNEQFHILVRMHLSFVLDLNTDQESECVSSEKKKWNLVQFNKKLKNQKNVTNSVPLTQEGICQIYQLIEFIKKDENIKIEGIFRRTGSLARQQELRNLINQGITLDLENSTFSVHDCASVVKGYLADLSDPLLTENLFSIFCQIADDFQPNNTTQLLVAIQLLLLLLPSENKILLKDVLNLLNLTASHEEFNRMSADNLAKLFTPHLSCPRQLLPEQLHINSQKLYPIIAFMINKSTDLFKIPQKISLDFRASYEKRLLSKDSFNSNDAANTVFTFVDKERTAKENEHDNTETALAQLYAHIQTLPESSKKRKLIKQFNKENGHGTPLQVIRSNKSLGDSIKKHIFHKKIVKKKHKDILLIRTPSQKEAMNINDNKYLTSTPLNVDTFTPVQRKSMSPITRSTQGMSKAMLEETMMTPRSRKPVLTTSITNTKSFDSDNSLTDTFKEYLYSRSILTTAEDSSFSSRTDDFNSSDDKMSDSLLCCLNGYEPEEKLVLKPKQFDENGQPIVFETFF